MRLLKIVILSIIGFVLFLMPLSPVLALNLDNTYLAQAGYWTCSQSQSCMPTQTGTGATESEARANLNRQIQSYPIVPGTPCNVVVPTRCDFVPIQPPPTPTPTPSTPTPTPSTPSRPPTLSTRRVFIKSAHGNYFLDHRIAGRFIGLADQPYNPATGAYNGELWQIVDAGGGRVFIKSAHGNYFLDHRIAGRFIGLADQPYNPATGAYNGELWQIVAR
ncbi:fascin domain-containing protein [Nostoc sp.]|uniref:fascin domain-containing protein n=1 Tax=Nostoc sp. TaxID=1180 RepID=UPI002FF8EE9C